MRPEKKRKSAPATKSRACTETQKRVAVGNRKARREGGARRSPHVISAAHNLALLSSILAIVSRCTSSGPSASRSVLAPANMRARGWSPHTPSPPCSWIAASMTNSAAFGAATLHAAMAPFAVLLPSSSSRRAASSVGEARAVQSHAHHAQRLQHVPVRRQRLPERRRGPRRRRAASRSARRPCL